MWTALAVYASCFVLLKFSFVQTAIADQLSTEISKVLGTQASVGRVELRLFNRVVADSLLVYDQKGKRMLSATRVSAGVELMPLLRGEIRISSAQLFGMKANIYRQDGSSPLNCQFVIDSLASRDTTSHTPLNLSIASLIIRNGSISYDQHDKPHEAGQFSPYHISAEKISSHLILYRLTDDSLHVLLKRMSFKEASGLEVKNFAGEVRYTEGKIGIDELKLSMPETTFSLPHLALQYAKDEKGEIRPGSVKFDVKAIAESISPKDFYPFIPKKIRKNLPVIKLNLTAEGTDRNANTQLSIDSEGSEIEVDVKAEAHNILEIPTAKALIRRLNLSESAVAILQESLDLPEIITRTGDIRTKAAIEYLGKSNIKAKADIETSRLGNVEIDGGMNGNSLQAKVKAPSFDIAKLLDDNKFGTVNCELEAEAGTDEKGAIASWGVKGMINELFYNGYNYHNILLDGTYRNAKLQAKLGINDPNVVLSADCEAENGVRKSIIADLSVGNFNPKALNLSNILDNKTMAFNAKANVKGTNLENALGCIEVNELIINSNDSLKEDIRLRNFTLTSMINGEGVKVTEMFSDFGNATMLGSFKDFSIDMAINNIDFARQLFDLPVDIKKPVKVNGFISTQKHTADINLSAPSIVAGGQEFQGTKIRVLPTERGWQGLLDSSFEIGDTLWTVNSDGISYLDGKVDVNNLRIGNANQYVSVNGVVSAANTDSIVAEIKNVNVNYVLNMVDFHSVRFDGFASGTAIGYGLLGDLQAKAHLDVGNFMFEQGRMGTLHADATYANATQKIEIEAVADDPNIKGRTDITGYVSPQQSCIDLMIVPENARLEFMQTFCSSFMEKADLYGTGKVRLHGPFSGINLEGGLVADGAFTLTPTNCRYFLERDSVTMIPNDIRIQNAVIKDKFGNTAYLTGGIHHRNLSKLTYDFYADTRRLLVYDFPNIPEGTTFCGYALIDGNVKIQGRDNELSINAEATPLRDSYLTYNASSPDAIASQDFITWGSASKPASATQNAVNDGAEKAEEAINADNDRTNMRMNFIVNTTPDARIHLLMDAASGDYIDLFGSGVLRVSYFNKGGLDIFGNYTVDKGQYKMTIQNMLRRDFSFQKGGVISFGGDPYNAILKMQAAYKLSSVSLSDLNIGTSFKSNNVPVTCLMNITGTPGKPVVGFDLDLPSLSTDARQMVYSVINSAEEMNQQVLYLLGIGRFYSQSGANDNAGHSVSQSSLAMQSFLSGTVTQQLNNMLKDAIGNTNWSFGANITPGTDGFNNAEYQGLVSGRLLNNRLIFDGRFGYRNNVMTNSQSIIGDFTLQYLLTPNGNLSLKVYNQSNDRYFTKSSLNTQGIGIVLQKEFGK